MDDVRVLEAIFLKLMTEATRGQVTLPMSANTAAERQRWGERAPAVTAAWAPVGAWTEGQPLVQGMKFVITGGTRTPRDELYLTGIVAGLTPMNSVSSRTSFLVCNDPALATRKAMAAGDLASAVIAEDKFRVLLQSVQRGTPIGARPVVRITATPPVGRLKGCRVLVLGGPHDVSARVRDEVMAHGGRVAVNLTPTVSHLIALGAADTDIRYPRTTQDLNARMDALRAGQDRPRVIVLQGASGVGKSRIIRELYRWWASRQPAPGYWPSLPEIGAPAPARAGAGSAVALANRKIIGPPSDDFVWPAGALPAFTWWPFNCGSMSTGDAIDVVTQARPSIQAHLKPALLAWRQSTTVMQRLGRLDQSSAERFRELVEEGRDDLID